MSFPKKGKFFPKENGYGGNGRQQSEDGFADEIAAALRRSLGDSRAGGEGRGVLDRGEREDSEELVRRTVRSQR